MKPTVPLFLLAAAAAPAQLVRQANTSLNLPAALPAATSFTTQNALGSLTFSAPLDVASPPGVTNRLFVVERGTGIQIVNLDTLTKSSFLTLATTTSSESGILSMAFHPNYRDNGYFYVFYSLTISGALHQRVARFQATGTPGSYHLATAASAATLAPLITQRDPAPNHNGGDMAFGPDGYLYFSTGDGGAQYDGGDHGRRIAKDFLGAVYRIDVDSKPGSLPPNPHDESSTSAAGDSAITAGSYRIPPDNPFVALAGDGTGTAAYNGFTFPKSAIRTEIWSIGYRNPWRFSFDPDTGRLFVADVGQDNYEEINLVTKGFNAGWSWREGKNLHTPARAPFTAPAGFTGADPIYEYDHTNDGIGSDAVVVGTAVCGGVVYRGDRLPELFGKYLFSEYNGAQIVALTEQANGTWTAARIASDGAISGWGYDPRNGDALLCDHTAGTIKRLVRSSPAGTAPPATLSATGAFQNLATLTPHAGIVAYAPNVSFWSDYAVKSRWFAIRNLTDTVTFNAAGNWSFAAGMVWIKHFDFDTTRGNPATRRKLETRFLVKTPGDVYGLTYKWRADQSDADLVAEDGLTESIAGASPPQTWRFPSRTDCRTCHTPQGGFALSFNTPQLNRPGSFGTQSINQITALSQAGYFSAPVTSVATLPAFAPAGDSSVSLEWRVRSYLSVNCVQCHQPGGPSSGYWDARETTPTDLAALIAGPLVNDGGDPDNRWCQPGDAAHSMILKRLSGAGVPRMPPLGTFERDSAAEQLLADWIASLPARRSFSQWQTDFFGPSPGSDAAPDADPDRDGQSNHQEYLTGSSPLSPAGAWSWDLTPAPAGGFRLEFLQPANRSVQVESSSDFLNWTLWDLPGNAPSFPAAAVPRSLTVPDDAERRYLRPKLSRP